MKNKNYPLYKVDHVNNLKELINHNAIKYGDKPAFTFELKNEVISISYRKFNSDVNALGTEFDFIGIKNAKIAVIGENSYEWILTYFAAVNSGNVIVPLDRELPAESIRNLINDSGAEVFVYSETYSDIAEYLQKNDAMIKHYFNMKDFPEMINRGEMIIRSGELTVVDYKVDNHALAAILYTSGTTGIAKGVMLSHKNLISNVIAGCKACFFTDVSLFVLPLHHSFAFTGGILIMLHSGCNIVINKSLKNVSEDLKKYKPSNTLLVPLFIETFYKKVWDNAKKSGKAELLKKLIKISNALLKIGIDIRGKLFKTVLTAFGGNIDVIITGGAPIDFKYIKGFRNFGIKILNGYGITECSPVVSVNRNNYYRDGSIGQVFSSCKVKIINSDENGHGEIYVMGDIVMLGYYNNEQATKEAFDGEWFKTGDIGYLDDDGFLFITGRKKNIIILNNGKNVYPEELEHVILNKIPYIKETVIYAEDNIIIAEMFLDTENEPECASRLSSDISKVNQELPQYMTIGKTLIRDSEFPKTTTKKIKRQYKNGGNVNA